MIDVHELLYDKGGYIPICLYGVETIYCVIAFSLFLGFDTPHFISAQLPPE